MARAAAKKKEAPKKAPSKKTAVTKTPAKKTKAEVVSLDDERKKRKGKAVEEVSETAVADFYAAAYTAAIDANEKKLQLIAGLEQGVRLSTGLLVLDLVTGGGLVPGMYSISGPEQSAKSTNSFHVLKSALKYNVPMIFYFDAENAVDQTYTGGILGVKDLTDVFGLRAGKNKGWIKRPRVRYYDTNVLEDVFGTIRRVLNDLPDKIYRADVDVPQWYLVFKRDQKQVTKMKEMQKAGLAQADKALYTETGQYWCPIGNDDRFQAAFFIDSYPGLLGEDIDDEKSEGNDLANDAKHFSKHVKRVKGKLKKKRAILYGVNQLRLKPMEKYNPEYEPGGEALKFYSDVRNIQKHRSMKNPAADLPGAFSEEEVSVFNSKRKDVYHYKKMKNIKNKKGTPKMEGWFRVWVSDHKRKAHGFDPVFDVFQYLVMTKQVTGNRKTKLKVSSPSKVMKQFEKLTFSWESFKALILAVHFGDKELIKLMKDSLGVKKLPDLRQLCFDQIASGEAFELMVRDTDESEEIESDQDEIDLEEDA